MDNDQIQNLKKIADLIYRRKALISFCVIIALAGGLGYYLKQPKLYESSALLSYQQQKINPARMSPDTEARIRDIVSTLTQIVTSRGNLERIITQEQLYSEALAVLPMSDVAVRMRNNIQITPSRQGDTFVVTFTHPDPDKVVRVTNALAARFIEENLKYREERATETSVYTEDELSMAKESLDKREELMRDFKLKYYNEMPEQQASNVSRLIALQNQHQNIQASIQDLQRTRLLLQEQITVRKQLVENAIAQTTRAGQAALMETDRQRLNRFQAELQNMLGRYTEQHPSVKALQRRISQLEESLAEETALIAGEGASESGGRFDQDLFGLEMQVKSIGLNIDKLNQERDETQKMIRQLESWVAQAPLREAEWSSLTREYAEMKRHYDFLVAQNLQARSALNLERNQKGSQFKIEDPAVRPNKPVKPSFSQIMTIAFLGGFGVGGILIFLLDMVDTSFRNPHDLEESIKEQFGVDLICSVPHLPLKSEVIKRRAITFLSSFSILIMASGLAGAFVYFYQNGRIIL